jgi:glycosyltransferase involved in cell wall biosynthesis
VPRPSLICLLPARNASEHLPGWFASVECFADAVVALDDGSTDDTRALLSAHPLVHTILENPVRRTYEGWDDAENRNRLLAAAAELNPRWVISLDADERITDEDALALRRFVASSDEHATAYVHQVFRMIGDDSHWDRCDLWAGRLFSFEPGQHFPTERLHFVPIPVSIAPSRWKESTVRIQHLAGLTESARRARYDKYTEVDRGLEFQDSYEHLLDPPGRVQSWTVRPPALPFERNGATGREPSEPDATEPVLSAVVISRDDETRIARSLRAVLDQEVSEPFEVICVVSGTDRTKDIVRSEFPSVRLIALDRPALPGEARNAGLAVARGRYISFPGSHVELPPGSLEARLTAHRQGYAMVTGTMRNGTDTLAGWASYFLDHSTAMPGRPTGPLEVFPAHCSYRSEPLRWAGGFPDIRAGEDTLVNKRLFDAGYGALRSQAVEVTHHTRADRPRELLRRSAIRGKGLAELLLAEHAVGRLFTRSGLRRYGLVYVPGRLRRIHRNVNRWGNEEMERRYRRSLPLIVAGAIVHHVSGWIELFRSLVLRLPG